jgi:hypothetical protein
MEDEDFDDLATTTAAGGGDDGLLEGADEAETAGLAAPPRDDEGFG